MRTRNADDCFADHNWLTPTEAARLIGGVSSEHVIRLVKAGELAARNVALSGTRYRIDPESVTAFNERRRVA